MAAIGVKVKLVEPGMIKADFGGLSFDFSNYESLVEDQGILKKVFSGFGASQATASEAILVADVIYKAVTDDRDQLRYIAGQDAEMVLGFRKSKNDESVIQSIHKQFAL